MTATTKSSQLAAISSLPPRPHTDGLRRNATARLRVIETDVLPALGTQRTYLERLWRSDESDAVPLYADGGHAILTHPAGADRLAGVLANQHAMRLEATALGALVATLHAYEMGGAAFVESESEAPPAAHHHGDEPDAFSEQAYTRWLLGYLLEVRQEIWAARRHGDSGLRDQLDLEFLELQKRIQARSAAVRALASAVCGPRLPRSA